MKSSIARQQQRRLHTMTTWLTIHYQLSVICYQTIRSRWLFVLLKKPHMLLVRSTLHNIERRQRSCQAEVEPTMHNCFNEGPLTHARFHTCIILIAFAISWRNILKTPDVSRARTVLGGLSETLKLSLAKLVAINAVTPRALLYSRRNRLADIATLINSR